MSIQIMLYIGWVGGGEGGGGWGERRACSIVIICKVLNAKTFHS